MFRSFQPSLIKSLTRSFSQSPIRSTTLTLYAKTGCSLCDKAKVVIEEVRGNEKLNKKISIQYVDITDPMNKEFWDKYCFDVPVLHLDKKNQETIKFMHYLNSENIINEINNDQNKFKLITEAF